ncbi:MAG: hypothetical protein HYX47_03055 [Burkholderiales bacterium]|nr:hypothetical protein [Burkholderiales bacterium]
MARLSFCALGIGALLAASQAAGATMTVEDDTLVAAPRTVAMGIQRFDKNVPTDYKGKACRYIGKPVALAPDAPERDWIVTTADACSWAASAAPVWVLREAGGQLQVVLFHVTYDVTVGSAAQNGLRNIATARATAARREEQLWKFDGERYQATRNTVR